MEEGTTSPVSRNLTRTVLVTRAEKRARTQARIKSQIQARSHVRFNQNNMTLAERPWRRGLTFILVLVALVFQVSVCVPSRVHSELSIECRSTCSVSSSSIRVA